MFAPSTPCLLYKEGTQHLIPAAEQQPGVRQALRAAAAAAAAAVTQRL